MSTHPTPSVPPGFTPGPWRWTSFEEGPQLEGNIDAAEMNPILVARGCGNQQETATGVKGCMPAALHDDLRACPLHPTAADRALIASAPLLFGALRAWDAYNAALEMCGNDPDAMASHCTAQGDTLDSLHATAVRLTHTALTSARGAQGGG